MNPKVNAGPVSFKREETKGERINVDGYEKAPERVIVLSHPAILIK